MAFTTMIVLCLATTVMAQPGKGQRGERGGPERGGERGERGGQERGGEMRRGGPGGSGGGRPDMGRMMQMMPVIAALDADKDGTISSDEINNAVAALKKLDKNGNGSIDAEEMRPSFGGRGGPGGDEMRRPGEGGERGAGRGEGGGRGGDMTARIMQADANGDGKISKDEAPERMAQMFDRLDQNSDGFVEKSEIEKMMSGRGGREGGAGGRGGDQNRGGQKPKRPESDG